MSDTAILAKAAGIGRALRDHPADVEEAVALAARFRSAFTRPTDPAAEPAPAYSAPHPVPALPK